ncbi:MAG TPA: DUF2857 domain-containing protein [Burkholderiaceae bacterium]
MSAPHPLNQAVVAQALHDLRNGQLRRCRAMGFGDAELEALKQPALISVLINASVSWCSVSVNREVLTRLLSQMEDVEQEIATVDRMLRLGASTEMVGRYYGLTHQEVALRRDILGLPKRKGRHPVLDEQQDAALWQRWRAALADSGIGLDDDIAMLAVAMDLSADMRLPMSVVWAAIQGWIEQTRR